jgi:hypothetical protein
MSCSFISVMESTAARVAISVLARLRAGTDQVLETRIRNPNRF